MMQSGVAVMMQQRQHQQQQDVGMFVCELCHVNCGSIHSLQQHMESQRHISKAAQATLVSIGGGQPSVGMQHQQHQQQLRQPQQLLGPRQSAGGAAAGCYPSGVSGVMGPGRQLQHASSFHQQQRSNSGGSGALRPLTLPGDSIARCGSGHMQQQQQPARGRSPTGRSPTGSSMHQHGWLGAASAGSSPRGPSPRGLSPQGVTPGGSPRAVTYVGPDAAVQSYCTQEITPELNTAVTALLTAVKAQQDRAIAKNATKVMRVVGVGGGLHPRVAGSTLRSVRCAVGRLNSCGPLVIDSTRSAARSLLWQAALRRCYVCGLREVRKAIKGGKAKAVLLAPNIEQVEAEGGLNESVGAILEACGTSGVPAVFALSRKKMGEVYGFRKRMSAVALLEVDAARELLDQVLSLAADGRQRWQASPAGQAAAAAAAVVGASASPSPASSATAALAAPAADGGAPAAMAAGSGTSISAFG
jgi:ribosomal protein L7Ae-like RNA K-turn-binding protein